MVNTFDPYHKWLGIQPSQQPPHHYRLLSLDLFESDREVIDAAANQRMAYLQDVAGGEHSQHSQRLLNEVSSARRCLLNAKTKAAYDEELRSKLTVTIEVEPISSVPCQTGLEFSEPEHEESEANEQKSNARRPKRALVRHSENRSKRHLVILGAAGTALVLILIGVLIAAFDEPSTPAAVAAPTPPPKQVRIAPTLPKREVILPAPKVIFDPPPAKKDEAPPKKPDAATKAPKSSKG